MTDVLIKAFGQHNAGAEAITDRFNKLEARMAEKDRKIKGKKLWCCNQPRRVIIYRVKMVL